MINAAHEKLQQLRRFPWFQNVGGQWNRNVQLVSNWKIAVKEYDSQKWENCRLMARNVLQREVNVRNWNRFNEWNTIIDSIRPEISKLAEEVGDHLAIPTEHQKIVGVNLRWDIMFMCVEHAYSDIVTPPFYLPLLEPWYAAGRLPCGWTGEEFPEPWDGVLNEGMLMVY